MRIRFTKMQGAGNDFVVLDETRERLNLSAEQYRFLADRHLGIGADQILSVRKAEDDSVDFGYAIHNADGGEVEHCGNGARCFVRYVRDRGLTSKDTIRVKVVNGVLELRLQPDGRVTVDMGAPVFDLERIPFDPAAATPETVPIPTNSWQKWPIALVQGSSRAIINVVVLSMGNPHAVRVVPDVDAAPVGTDGPLIQRLAAFPSGVNVGFMQVQDRVRVRLRVFERGAGETLSCGTGACAAVVAGVRLGLLDPRVDVQTRGGVLSIEWAGGGSSVLMTGPATTVFEGEIELP